MASRALQRAIGCSLAEGSSALADSTRATAYRGIATTSTDLQPSNYNGTSQIRTNSTSQIRTTSQIQPSQTTLSRAQHSSTLPVENITVPFEETQRATIRERVDYEDKVTNLKKLLYLEIPPFVKANPYNNDYLPRLDVDKFQNMDKETLESFYFPRKTKQEKLSQYLTLHTPESKSESAIGDRPLAVVFPWLMSKPRAVQKYVGVYTCLGYDVLQVTITPVDLLMPPQRSQVAAKELLDFLAERQEYARVLSHCLSVGTYMLYETMAMIESQPDKYGAIKGRFSGVVQDSPCELPGFREGVARSVTGNRAGQRKVMQALDWVLDYRYDTATRHHIKTQDLYDEHYVGAPCLYLYSRTDPISSAEVNSKTTYNYHHRGFEVYSRIFPDTPHVGHMAKYKTEYVSTLLAFLDNINFLPRESGL